MTIFITGGSGFLGSHLVKSFLDFGYSVITIRRPTTNFFRIGTLLDKIKIYDENNLELAFSQNSIDILVHTACCYGRSGETLKQLLEANVVFGLKLAELAIKFSVKAFINTDSLLPKNVNAYSMSKSHFVDWLRFVSKDIQVVNLRFDHLYGPLDDEKKFIYWFLQKLRENVQSVDLTTGEQLRDFIYINDVVSAYSLVLCKLSELSNFEEFDVGTGCLVSVKDFLLEMNEQFLIKYPLTSTLLRFGVIPYRENDVMQVKINTDKVRSIGWCPKIYFKSGISMLLGEICK